MVEENKIELQNVFFQKTLLQPGPLQHLAITMVQGVCYLSALAF